MSGGGGCPEAGTQGSLPGSAVRRPSRKNSGWRGGRFRGALTPHTMPYRVITECAFRCHAGPGPPVSRVGILRPPRPFSACGPSPPPCTVWLFFQDRLRQALRSRKPGVRRCVGFLNGSHVLSSRSSLCGALKRRCTRMGGSSRWTPPGPSPRRCLWPGTSSRPWARRTGWRRRARLPDRRPQGRVPLPRLHRHAQPRLAVRHVENALPLSGHRAP